ncbi:hypothetical protein [Sorangium cellulosum]|uniref:hypothetical protein n=1 Tax=Sorangium cellulosum TaxID=56 RepID=UPI00040CBD58|nr:hypothetical protein [Sorangium cellulosum]
MRSLHRCFRLALPAAAAALGAVAGCYPDVTFTGGPGDAGAGGDYAGTTASSASTAASSADVAGSGGGAASSGAGGDGGGAAASGGGGGAGGDGAGGGAATSSASSTSATSGAGGGGTVDCDADDDGYRSKACEGGNDCNDDNPLVHPGQPSTFYDTPISPGGGFDYDCSGAEEREFRSINCSGLLTCAVASNVFLADVPCGQRGPFGSCGLTCQSDIVFPNYLRACH